MLGLDGEGFQLSVQNSITGRALREMISQRLSKVGAGIGVIFLIGPGLRIRKDDEDTVIEE